MEVERVQNLMTLETLDEFREYLNRQGKFRMIPIKTAEKDKTFKVAVDARGVKYQILTRRKNGFCVQICLARYRCTTPLYFQIVDRETICTCRYKKMIPWFYLNTDRNPDIQLFYSVKPTELVRFFLKLTFRWCQNVPKMKTCRK